MAKKPSGTVNTDALDNVTGIQSAVFDTNQIYDEMNKKAHIYTNETRDALSRTTSLNKLLESSKDLLGKIGTQIIKNNTYTGLTNKLTIEIAKLESKRRVLEKSQTVEDAAKYKILKDHSDAISKIEEDSLKHSKESSKAYEVMEEVTAEIEKKKKKGLLTDTQKNILNQKFTKFAKLEEEHLNHISDNLKKQKVIEESMAKVERSQSINNLELTDKQIEAAKQTLDILEKQDKAIESANSKLRRGNLLRAVAQKLGLTHVADFAKHKETFGAGVAAGIVAVGLLAAAIKAIVDILFATDKQITGIAKQLGLSKDGARLLRDEFVRASKGSTVLNNNLDLTLLSIQNQVGAMNELNEQLGIAVIYSGKQIQDQIVLTKEMGLTGEEAADIQKVALINHQTAQQTADVISDQTVAFRKQTGVMLDGRKVLSEVAKIEGQLAVQYKNNPSLIAQAVMQVKKYGLSLEEAKKSAESLLDFESSISNELEAELLTGKQYNFERARALALAGDSAAATEEMVKQVGTLNDFTRLNVIQQNAMAKAIGLSSDELANSLRQQELLRSVAATTSAAYAEQLKYAKSQNREAEFLAATKNATNGAELDANLAQISSQMKFEEGLSRIKEMFGNIFSDAFLTGLQKLVTAFSNHLPQILGAISTLGSVIIKVASWIPGNTVHTEDSAINPQGRVVISTPKGAIVPDRNDSIITTTNPQGLLGGGGSDMAATNAKLDQLIALLKQPGNVYLDSRKVGTTQGLAYDSWA